MSRREFLDRRREICRRRFDELHSPVYDDRWGSYINPTHREFVSALASEGGEVVDIACGTGKYWPMLLAAGCRVVGVDQSAGMLVRANAKHPDVPTYELPMQDLAQLERQFDGLLCIDAMENVGPEDWPVVLRGCRGLLKPSAPAYFTVELPDESPRPPTGDLVAGEVLHDEAYHYFPTPEAVLGWLAEAGFTVTEQRQGDGYWHLLTSCGS